MDPMGESSELQNHLESMFNDIPVNDSMKSSTKWSQPEVDYEHKPWQNQVEYQSYNEYGLPMLLCPRAVCVCALDTSLAGKHPAGGFLVIWGR